MHELVNALNNSRQNVSYTCMSSRQRTNSHRIVNHDAKFHVLDFAGLHLLKLIQCQIEQLMDGPSE